jgi:hypothetical protein
MIILRKKYVAFISNLPEPTAFGNTSLICGVYFLTNELKKTWSEAYKFCCEFRMNLVSVYSLEKQNCLYDLLAKRKLQFTFREISFTFSQSCVAHRTL